MRPAGQQKVRKVCSQCRCEFTAENSRRRLCHRCYKRNRHGYVENRNARLRGVKTTTQYFVGPPMPPPGLRRQLMTDGEQMQINLRCMALDVQRCGLGFDQGRSLDRAEIDALVAAGQITPINAIPYDRNQPLSWEL